MMDVTDPAAIKEWLDGFFALSAADRRAVVDYITQNDEGVLSRAVIADLRDGYDLDPIEPESDFNSALASGASWAKVLATIVAGHEATNDLEDDIDHVKAEHPGLFSCADIAAAFQEKAERHARFVELQP